MEERKTILVSAPDIDANKLFGIYILIPSNQEKTLDDFTNFLTTESVERDLFLNEHCSYKFLEKEDSIILRYNIKE